MTPWSSIQHVGILLENNMLFHMTSRGIRTHQLDQLMQQKWKNTYRISGYIAIHDQGVRNQIDLICRTISEHPELMRYIDWKCPMTISRLLSPVIPCISMNRAQARRSQQVLDAFQKIVFRPSQASSDFITVCSTTIFLIVALSIRHTDPAVCDRMIERINFGSCLPENILDLCEDCPLLFQRIMIIHMDT